MRGTLPLSSCRAQTAEGGLESADQNRFFFYAWASCTPPGMVRVSLPCSACCWRALRRRRHHHQHRRHRRHQHRTTNTTATTARCLTEGRPRAKLGLSARRLSTCHRKRTATSRPSQSPRMQMRRRFARRPRHSISRCGRGRQQRDPPRRNRQAMSQPIRRAGGVRRRKTGP